MCVAWLSHSGFGRGLVADTQLSLRLCHQAGNDEFSAVPADANYKRPTAGYVRSVLSYSINSQSLLTCFSLRQYLKIPEVSAAAIFALFFTVLTVMSVMRASNLFQPPCRFTVDDSRSPRPDYTKRRMVIWLPIGLTGMAIGYGIRVLSHFKVRPEGFDSVTTVFC